MRLVALADGGAQTGVRGLDLDELPRSRPLTLRKLGARRLTSCGALVNRFEYCLGAPRELRNQRETEGRAATGQRVRQAMDRGESPKLLVARLQFQITFPARFDGANLLFEPIAIGAPQTPRTAR